MMLGYGDYRHEECYSADVVVVGTGAGGAVVGAQLAEGGLDVLFVEEGGHHPTSSFNPYVTESVPRLYRDSSATVILGRPPIPYIEGRCVGGGTTVNGGMIRRVSDRVLEQWEREAGVDLGPRALAPFIERMEREVCAEPQLAESLGEDNRIMKAGAEKLGWQYLDNRRAQRRCVGANSCILGCPTGAKQSMLVSFVPRAMARGARCLTEVRVERLIIESGRCVGVSGHAIDPKTRRATKKIAVRARAVVIACGAVQTPLLLQAHRLGRPSGLLGGNFTCHPNVKVLAVYPHDVRAWQGVSQAGQISEFEDRGIKLAENMVPPGALASQLHCHGKEAWELMQDYNRIVLTGVLIHDSTTGTVGRAPLGLGGARYFLTRYDHARLVEGARHLAELHFAMGAERVLLPFAHLPVLRKGDDLSQIDASRIGVSDLDLFTVHLMGSARMGRSPKSSVVDLSGQLWDLPGCYVADASLFPTAIGTNPQGTIMALASLVASRIALAPRVRKPAGLQGFVRTQARRVLDAARARAAGPSSEASPPS